MTGPQFIKGHGTQNDFIVLPDLGGELQLTINRITALCDRQRGVGADGVLRVCTAQTLLDQGVLDRLPADVEGADWFMDYRNADGSLAEMCGNGVRVYAHFLAAAGLTHAAKFVIGTRAGRREVVVNEASADHVDVTVEMGHVRQLGKSSAVLGGTKFGGLGYDVGNPHLVLVDAVRNVGELAQLDLRSAPEFDHRSFPNGVNIEFLTPLRNGELSMRVFERGVGETRSCGTGTVAAAAAALNSGGSATGDVAVNVPGGVVHVRIADQTSFLRGPSQFVAAGHLDAAWWDGLG